MSVDKDEATQRAERDREAAAKRMQNALPAWHLKSTISGHLTALGIRENAIAEANGDDVNRLPSSNDAILRGLAKPDDTPIHINEDVKPVLAKTNDADCTSVNFISFYPFSRALPPDYEQYYSSLAVSAMPSSQNTPAMDNLNDFGEEEEDVKPSVQYLDSLNEYRKRSRSRDDRGDGRGPSKTPKLNGWVDPPVVAQPEVQPEVPLYEEVPPPPGDDPIVYGMSCVLFSLLLLDLFSVHGEPMAFSAVTEEHHDLMTPEEYTAYFDVLQTMP